LYYNRGRYYSPELQRFISEDPVGLAGGINLYAYAGNNPISFADPTGLDPVEVVVWNPTLFENFNGLGGHVSYVIDGKMYSWEGNGRYNITQNARDYIVANEQIRSGMGYVIDFGSDAENEAFKERILHAYDGHTPLIGFPFPQTGYNLFTNNCGEGFCRAVGGMGHGLEPDNSWTPWDHRAYIENRLGPLVKRRYYYPYLGGRGCAEYSTEPGGITGFFGKLAQDIGNLYGYF
jgi:uncharacterized protein RhaS with RHS repeats